MKVPEFTGDYRQYFKNLLCYGSERAVADLAVGAIQSDKQRFDAVLDLCFTEKYPICMRAARVIQLYCERDLTFLMPELDEILRLSLGSEVEGVKRNFLKIFSEFVDFKYLKDSGLLINRCFEFLLDGSQKPGIRVHCLALLYKFALEEKDIARELLETLEFLEEEPLVSFRNCKNKTLQKLKALV